MDTVNYQSFFCLCCEELKTSLNVREKLKTKINAIAHLAERPNHSHVRLCSASALRLRDIIIRRIVVDYFNVPLQC